MVVQHHELHPFAQLQVPEQPDERRCEVGLASFLHRSYINGKGSFVDAHTVHIEGKQDITANHIVIATGGRPGDSVASFSLSQLARFLVPASSASPATTCSVSRMLPGRTLIVGASYIALECAGF